MEFAHDEEGPVARLTADESASNSGRDVAMGQTKSCCIFVGLNSLDIVRVKEKSTHKP